MKNGKRRDRIVIREYLIDYCCYDCLPKMRKAKSERAGDAACIVGIVIIIILVVGVTVLIIASENDRKNRENNKDANK